jgi:hypothetical protein
MLDLASIVLSPHTLVLQFKYIVFGERLFSNKLLYTYEPATLTNSGQQMLNRGATNCLRPLNA